MACPAVRSNTAWRSEPALAALLAAALFLQPATAMAQARDTDPELEELIPDSAIDRPDDWAKAPADQSAPIQAEIAPEVDAASPLDESGEIAIPWPDEAPDLPQLAPLEPDPELQQAFGVPEESLPERRGDVSQVSPRLALVYPVDAAAFPVRRKFEQRFRALSAIERLRAEGDQSAAQLAVRARSDRDLLLRLLRIYGYYDAEVTQSVSGIAPGEDAAGEKAMVRFDILPGARFRFGAVDLASLESAGADYPALRDAYAIQSGDPLSSDRIVTSRLNLDAALGESGYAFATLGEPGLLVDHRREEGDITQPVTPGGKYRIAGIASSNERFLSARHLMDIARFERGDIYKRSEVEDLRRAIVATGLVASVATKPREVAPPVGGEPGEVVLDVTMAKAPLRTIAGQVGYEAGEGFRAEASWEHRNLFPPEGLLRLRGIVGTKEQLAGVTFRRNNFRGRDQVLTLDFYGNLVRRDAYEARTVALTGNFEKVTTLIFQKPWTWAVGFEAVLTDEREGDVNGAATARRTYKIAALPLRAAYDGSDDLLDPTRGFRAALRISPELSWREAGGQSAYARLQADASAYLPLGRVVLAARGRIGSIPGASIAAIAPSRRFYAGGGGSVRGYGFQEIGPRDTLGDPSGGRSLSEFSLEARVRVSPVLSVVPFIDAGAVDESVTPRLRDIRYGAGIGVRYKTSFGPIRVDLGTPLNRRPGESRIAVYVALGQAF